MLLSLCGRRLRYVELSLGHCQGRNSSSLSRYMTDVCGLPQVARSSRLDPLLLLSIKDSRDTLDRQLRQLTMAAPSQYYAARDAIDEATNLLMDLDAVLGN